MGRPQRSNFDFLFSISSPIIDYSNRSLRIRYNRQQHFNNAQLSSAITVNLNSKVELHLKLITEKKLDLVRERDLETLAVLDDHGLLMGPGETVEQFADRLQLLSANINQFKSDILESGAIDIFDTHLEKAGAIPTKDFKPALEKTRDLYDFEIDWVPGFYTNDRMGVLFAGCAFYSTDDYFALFVVRKAFEKNERWLIYSRTELLAHELCHIAHMGFGSVTYEEMFAYQTSPSRFRRVVGGVFRTPLDSYLILGSVMLLAAAQVVNRFVGEMIPLTKPPIVFFVMAVVFCFSVVIGRYTSNLRVIKRARKRLRVIFEEKIVRAILFRCSDDEIAAIADTPTPDALRTWLQDTAAADIRWQVILQKYPV